MLTTDQTNTLLKTLMIFIENRDPFTIESIVNEIKRNGDQYDGFYDDKGSCIVEDYYTDICEVVDEAISNLYKEWIDDLQTVYVFRPAYAHPEDYEDEDWDDDDYDEIEDLNDYEVDKEGNRLPDNSSEVYDDTKEDDENPGAGYYKDPTTGEWMWDRDAAESARYEEGDFENYGQEPETKKEKEFHDSDHPITYNLKVDKNKRITVKKAIFKEAGWKDNEEVVVIGNETDHSQFYIARKEDIDNGEVKLTNDEYEVGTYILKKGALRLSVSGIFEDISPDEIMQAKVIWENETGFNYICVGFDID